MITLNNLKMSFGAQTIFDDVTFNINKKERIGLVGRNGYGKTTLFNLISGQLSPEAGVITVPKNYNIGYVKQDLTFSEKSVLAEACLGLPQDKKTDVWLAEKVLSGLGFSVEETCQHPKNISGGYQVRLNLAKVLISNPDLLLLDEPTNYLDILSIRWLKNYLKSWNKEMMLVTHDRNFMDTVTTHAMIIHRNNIRKMHGGSAKLYDQIAKEEEIYEKTRINDEKKRKEKELFISRFRAKARLAGQAQSMIKKLEKNKKLERLSKIPDLEFSFHYAPFKAKNMIDIHNLSFSYNNINVPDQHLIKNLSFNIAHNDRICVIGKNGKGKTTLLKLINEEIQPVQGSIKKHAHIVTGYYGQSSIDLLNPHNTIEEELYNTAEITDRKYIRSICGVMLFEGDQALKKISILSGGEKSRVLLGKILLSPVNLLVLDEPSNHLDIEACDSLFSAMHTFPGAIIMVTHNEMFLHTLANKLIIFDEDSITVFNGTYQDFLDKGGWQQEKGSAIKQKIKNKDLINKKDIRKYKAEILRQKSKILNPLENQVTQLELLIEKNEEKLHKINQKIIKASQIRDSQEINKLSIECNEIQKQINTLYTELDQVLLKHEEQRKYFEKEMKKNNI